MRFSPKEQQTCPKYTDGSGTFPHGFNLNCNFKIHYESMAPLIPDHTRRYFWRMDQSAISMIIKAHNVTIAYWVTIRGLRMEHNATHDNRNDLQRVLMFCHLPCSWVWLSIYQWHLNLADMIYHSTFTCWDWMISCLSIIKLLVKLMK